mgnify:FL=1
MKSLRKLIILQTIQATKNQSYPANGMTVHLGKYLSRQGSQRSRNYAYDEFTLPNQMTSYEHMVISVENRDSIDMGLRLKQLGYNPVVLNMVCTPKKKKTHTHAQAVSTHRNTTQLISCCFRRTQTLLVGDTFMGRAHKRKVYSGGPIIMNFWMVKIAEPFTQSPNLAASILPTCLCSESLKLTVMSKCALLKDSFYC